MYLALFFTIQLLSERELEPEEHETSLLGKLVPFTSIKP